MDTKTVNKTQDDGFRPTTVVVVRHGERLDYVQRAQGKNWCQANPEQPWNPPLTDEGVEMARALGTALKEKILPEMRMAPIAAVYTSPFLRCRQTAAGIIGGMSSVVINDENNSGSDGNGTAKSSLKVRVELGLSESMNENWFRSWSLPGADGTWGYKKEVPLNQFEVDPRALQPAETLLNWKDSTADTHRVLDGLMDQEYQSRTSIGGDYSLAEDPPKLESFRIQRDRMSKTMNLLAANERGRTIVLVSHGGPVTHLYENLTGNSWQEHGVAKYCSFSIYQNQQETSNGDGRTGGTESKPWTPLVVNRVLWEPAKDDDSNKDPSR